MRVYDIALVLVRTLVAVDLIRAGLNIFSFGFSYAFLAGGAPSGVWQAKVELGAFFSMVFAFVVPLVLYACSKPIARFASKLSSPTDTATNF